MSIIIKSKSELARMREAGRVTATVLELLRQRIEPGISTAELDDLAYQQAIAQGAYPSFKGYHGYPASVCTSINNEVVHGIPSKSRLLKAGDIVSLDFGVVCDGFQGDAAITVPVGEVSEEVRRLLEVTEQSLAEGVRRALAGKHLSDVSWAIQSYVERHGFSVVTQYVGHGIGRSMHEDPQIPNFGPPGHGPILRPGMTLALEPMVNAGGSRTRVLSDNWTVVTEDGSLSAHFEHTVAVCEDGPEILTLL
ncbi:MAG: type I methionyl aminopeptidase [Chloroflexi bacterium]|nr:type I methionyl aminopeptidase [Chloroflexota bacterium]